MLKTLETQLATLKNQAELLHAELEAKGDKATADERTKLQNMLTEGKALAERVNAARAIEGATQPAGETPAPKANGGNEPFKSLGQRFIESKEFKGRGSNPIVKALFETKADEIVGVSGIASTQAFPVWAQRLTEIYSMPRVDLALLGLFARGDTNSNAIVYMQQTTRTNNAAETQELGTKPQSILDWSEVTAPVRTIAHWVAASEQVLEDEPRLVGMINDELIGGLMERLQTQLLSGNGTAPNLAGLLNTAGTNNRVHATSGARFLATDTKGETIRRMLTDIRLAFGTPTGVVLNPADAEEIELTREGTGTGQYLSSYDVATGRIWRVPVLESAALTAGTAIAGDFARGAKYYVRSDARVETDRVSNQFLTNQFTIRAEMRAAFTVPYPAFFSKATGM